MTMLIAIVTDSGLLGLAGGSRVVVALLLHEHVNSCLKKVGTDTTGIEVGWRGLGVLCRFGRRPGDIVGLHLQLVPLLSQQ
jgi:hypothetical protein